MAVLPADAAAGRPASGPPAHASIATGAAVLAAVLFSTGGLFIKLAPMPGLAVVCGRALVCTLFFAIVLRPNLRHARFDTAVVYALMMGTFVVATKLTTAANAVLLQFTGTAYVLVLGPVILKERFRPVDAISVAASLAGMALLSMEQIGPGQRTGNVIAGLSGVFYAFTVVLLRRDATAAGGAAHGGAHASAMLGNLFAAVAVAPFAVSDLSAALTPRSVAVLLYLGTIQVGLGYAVFNWALRHLPAARASLVLLIEPVMNPIWVALFLGERPGPWALAGGGIVLSAVVLRTLLRR